MNALLRVMQVLVFILFSMGVFGSLAYIWATLAGSKLKRLSLTALCISAVLFMVMMIIT